MILFFSPVLRQGKRGMVMFVWCTVECKQTPMLTKVYLCCPKSLTKRVYWGNPHNTWSTKVYIVVVELNYLSPTSYSVKWLWERHFPMLPFWWYVYSSGSKLPCEARMWKRWVSDMSPPPPPPPLSPFPSLTPMVQRPLLPLWIGTSNHMTTSLARCVPRMQLMRTWTLVMSFLMGHEKWTWYVTYRTVSSSVVPMAVCCAWWVGVMRDILQDF